LLLRCLVLWVLSWPSLVFVILAWGIRLRCGGRKPDRLLVKEGDRVKTGQPQIVLADEPTTALDSKSGREVVNLMQKLAKEQGCTILLVTHDNRILDITDRIVHMEDGKLA
jgi:predicted ABC-type transport system involved in lysophospholipase L1 biosynthesis ATPase subunit